MAVAPYVSRSEIWLANSSFRTSFQLPEHFHTSLFRKWFPGHMAKGLRVMQKAVMKCDCVLEVHDARIPFTGRNPKLEEILAGRPRVLALTKFDLTDKTQSRVIKNKLESEGIRTVLINNKSPSGQTIYKIIPTVLEALKDAEYEGSYTRKDPDAPYKLMVCGLPNTGKSSIINSMRRTFMRKGKAARVGKSPGITKSLQEKVLVADEPKMYVLDTPGVVSPYVPTAEVGMRLASIGCFKDNLIGEDLIADFILFTLNQRRNFEYVQTFGLDNPSDNIDFVLRQIAMGLRSAEIGRLPNYLEAAVQFMSKFRSGELGRITFH